MNSKNNIGEELFRIAYNKKKFSIFGGSSNSKQNNIAVYEKGIIFTEYKGLNSSKEVEYVIPAEKISSIQRIDNLYIQGCGSEIKITGQIDDRYVSKSFLEEFYPNIVDKMEGLYDNEWKSYSRNYSDTIKWILAITANWNIVVDRDYNVFGPINDGENLVNADINILKRDWGITNTGDLEQTCEILYKDILLVNECRDFLNNPLDSKHSEYIVKIEPEIRANFPNCITAYNLYRLVLIATHGYTATYFTYEESLDWCLKAAQKLQSTFSSWDDYYNNFMLGYCFWSGDDADKRNSHANKRKVAYEETKKNKKNPWNISWDTELQKTW